MSDVRVTIQGMLDVLTYRQGTNGAFGAVPRGTNDAIVSVFTQFEVEGRRYANPQGSWVKSVRYTADENGAHTQLTFKNGKSTVVYKRA